MDVDPAIKVMAMVLLLASVAATSAAYGALTHVNRTRLRHLSAEGVPRARALVALIDRIPPIETTAAAAFAAALALTAGLTTILVVEWLAEAPWAALGVGIVALLALLWLQLVSRAIGSWHPEATLLPLRWPLQVMEILLRPVTLPLRGLIKVMVPGQREPVVGCASGADDELRMMVDAREEGGLEDEEREMIHGIFELGETTAREIMVPRVDMAAVDGNRPLGEVLRKVKARGHSRIPIYEGTIDNIVGVVHAKDILAHLESGSLDDPARTLGRPAHFIPESKKIDELLHEMQQDRVHMSIVLDEYGGTAGLVTIEDLLEEIVGEIQDEYDMEEKPIELVSDQEAVFDARVSVHDVNDVLGTGILNGEFDTVGGLAYDRLGKIPVVGDEVHIDGISLTILSTVGKRIKKVRIRVSGEASPANGQADQ